MDTRSGMIHMMEQINQMPFQERKFMKEMKIEPTPAQMGRKPPRVGRNEPCPCGSGKKFKKCCLVKR